MEAIGVSTITYAFCNACGWRWDAEDGQPNADGMAARFLAEHVRECPEANPLMVPMWSVAHPYYWLTASVAYREGNGPQPDYGYEATWRPVGSHSTGSPYGPGYSEKTWHLFPS
jgi:hypothetical protein